MYIRVANTLCHEHKLIFLCNTNLLYKRKKIVNALVVLILDIDSKEWYQAARRSLIKI